MTDETIPKTWFTHEPGDPNHLPSESVVITPEVECVFPDRVLMTGLAGYSFFFVDYDDEIKYLRDFLISDGPFDVRTQRDLI